MSNLPPGVTVDMLPGNRPSDIAYEDALDSACSDLEWTINDRMRELVADADADGIVIDPADLLAAVLHNFGYTKISKGEE